MTEISKMLAGCNSSEHSRRQCKDCIEEIVKLPASLAVAVAYHTNCIAVQSLDLPLPSFTCS